MPITVAGRRQIFSGTFLAREGQTIEITENLEGVPATIVLHWVAQAEGQPPNQISWRGDGPRLTIDISGPAPALASSIEPVRIGALAGSVIYFSAVLQRAGNANLLIFNMYAGGPNDAA